MVKHVCKAQGEYDVHVIERVIERRAESGLRGAYRRERPTHKQMVKILEDSVGEGWAEVLVPARPGGTTRYRFKEAENGQERT